MIKFDEEINEPIQDLIRLIQSMCIGSVEYVVTEDACKSLILNWNDHNPDNEIDEQKELATLQKWLTGEGK